MAFSKEERIKTYRNYEKIRQVRGYSDYYVAKKIEIGTAMFSHWKQGRYIPKYEKLRDIAICLDTTVEAIMGD